MSDRTAYITGLGAHLPGEVVGNEEMARILGITEPRALTIGRRALRQNRIRGRHYALDRDGQPTTTNAAMAAAAGRAALEAAGDGARQVDFLAAASSQGDMMAPGLGSAVHGHLGGRPMEVASFTSFCASGMMAMKAAVSGVLSGLNRRALVAASEFASRFLRQAYLAPAKPRADTEFLRWTLSDGAGAAVISDRPAPRGLSLRIDHIDLVSYADRMPTCMYGGVGNDGVPDDATPWSQFGTLQKAVESGAFHLRQDLKLLDQIVPLGLARYMELIDDGVIDPAEIDWALYHFSSDVFRQRMLDLAYKLGVPINHNRIFTNLYEKGNTGSASIYIMLEELVASGRARPGQKILCMVPESGRFIVSFMLLTVVGEAEGGEEPGTEDKPVRAVEPASPDQPSTALSPPVQALGRRLAQVWTDFESSLNTVPIVQRLNRGRLSLEDYRAWLLNIRQQVVDGSRWIARAASNISLDDVNLRSVFVGHAGAEHRDYTLLEADYVACGGDLEAIRRAPKNLGSEALSAWMFHRAAQENPFDLLGAMFVIEGLGLRIAPRWTRELRRQLRLDDGQIRFLSHHAEEDEGHLEKLWQVLEALPLTPALADSIVRTAEVTARLYRLQLEEIALS